MADPEGGVGSPGDAGAGADQATEAPFADASRIGLVTGMLELFDEVRASGQPIWVSLEAPSGWGKTRVARELYARLAADRQEDPRYWPPAIVAEADADLSARRKRVAPTFAHAPGSLPGYAWWAISCSMRNGVASVALAEDLAQLEAHAPYLEDAWRDLRTLRDRLAGADELGRAVLDEAAMTGVGELTAEVVGTAVPGLGLVRWLGTWSWNKAKQGKERRSRLESVDDIEASHNDLVDAVMTMFTRLARPGLPVVVFVEDAHDADPVLVELLGRLSTSDSAVLIVTTAWPGHLEGNPALSQALAAAPRCIRVTSAGSGLPSPFPAGSGLGQLSNDALAGMVRHYYPLVDATTLGRIVARFSNPLALELFTQLPRFRMRFADGRLTLSQAEVDALPTTVRDLYRSLWNELPEPVRQALSVATLGIPRAISPDAGHSALWNHPLLVEAMTAVGLPDADTITRSLDDAPTAYAWARIVSDTLRRFSEPDQLAIATEDRADFLFDDEVRRIYNALAAQVGARLEEDGFADDADREHAARLVLALHAEAFIDDPAAVLQATTVILQLLDDLLRELPERLALAERALGLGAPEDHRTLEIRRLYSRVLSEAGRREAAIAEIRHVVDALTVLDGPSALSTLAAKRELGAALGVDGQRAGLVAFFEQLAEDATTALTAKHELVLRIRNNIAVEHDLAGRDRLAIEQYAAIRADASAALGPHHQFTLTVSSNLALVYGDVERDELALATHREVLLARIRTLGPTHPQTLASRYEEARTLGRLGRYAEAQVAFERLIVDEEQVFGPDHVEPMGTRVDLANLLAEAGRPQAAVEAWRQLVEMRERNGSDRTLVLASRAGLAWAMAKNGQLAAARQLSQEILQERTELRGPLHHETIETRKEIARLTLEMLESADAIDQLERLAVDVEGEFGRADPLTIACRWQLANAYHSEGRPRDALRLFLELLADVEAEGTGGDAAERVRMLNGASAAHEALGDLEQAIDTRQQALALVTESLGAQAPLSIWTRGSLADAYRNAGRADEALPHALALATLLSASDPAKHGPVLEARRRVALTLSALGRHEEAMAEFVDVHAARSAQGAPFSELLEHRCFIVGQLDEQGDLDAAMATAEEALDEARDLRSEDEPTITMLNVYAWLLETAGRGEDCYLIRKETAEIQSRRHPPTHQAVLSARMLVARQAAMLDRLDEAQQVTADVIRLADVALGPDSVVAVNARKLLAICLHVRGDPVRSAELSMEVARSWERTLGELHPNTLAALFDVGERRGEAGAVSDAIATHEGVLEARLAAAAPDVDVEASRAALAKWQEVARLEASLPADPPS